MRALALLCVLAASACQGPTELLLVVQSDLPLDQLVYVEIATSSSVDSELVVDDDGGTMQPCICVSPQYCDDAVELPLTIPLEPGRQGTTQFEVVARAHGASGGKGCSTKGDPVDSAILSFAPHERLGVYLSLNARCVGITCEGESTCNPDTGACISSVTTGVKIGDMSTRPIDASVVDAGVPDFSGQHDAGPSQPDMALPYFTITQIAAGDSAFTWDVSSAGADFSLIALSNGTVYYGPVPGDFTHAAALPASPDGTDYTNVCVSTDQGRYLYGVGSGADVWAYEAGPVSSSNDAGAAPLAPLFEIPAIGGSAELQCREDPLGVTMAWLSLSTGSGAGQQGGLYAVRSSYATNVDAGIDGGLPATATRVAPAIDFALATTGYGGTIPADTVGTIVLSPAPMGHPEIGARRDGGVGLPSNVCLDVERWTYDPQSESFLENEPVDGDPCVDLSQNLPFVVAADEASTVVAGADPTDGVTFTVGVPNGELAEPFGVAFTELALAPLPTSNDPAVGQTVALAGILAPEAFGQNGFVAGLYVARATPMGVISSHQLLSTTPETMEPVKIAVSSTGTVLVTWIEPITAPDGTTSDYLVGELVTP